MKMISCLWDFRPSAAYWRVQTNCCGGESWRGNPVSGLRGDDDIFEHHCRRSHSTDGAEQRSLQQLSTFWGAVRRCSELKNDEKLSFIGTQAGKICFFFCRWILCKPTVWQMQFRCFRWFRRSRKPPTLSSIWQIFKCVLREERGKEGAHICIHDWLRISVGVLTRIANEQTVDDIILGFLGGISLIRITLHSHLGAGSQLLCRLPVKASLSFSGSALQPPPTTQQPPPHTVVPVVWNKNV